MFDHTHKLRRLASLGATVLTAIIVAPTAIADPPTIPSRIVHSSSPGLGEHLSGRDRVWLASSSTGLPRLGEQLSGADRRWLNGSSGSPEAQASSGGFDWADAGIGAGFAFAAVVLGGGGALVIRRHPPLAH